MKDNCQYYDTCFADIKSHTNSYAKCTMKQGLMIKKSTNNNLIVVGNFCLQLFLLTTKALPALMTCSLVWDYMPMA